MQTRVEGERFLLRVVEMVLSRRGLEDRVPTVTRNHAWNQDNAMVCQKVVAERLLTGGWDAGVEPVSIGKRVGVDDMHRGDIDNPR